MAILDRFRKNKSDDASSEEKKQTKKPAAKTVASDKPKAKTKKTAAPAKKAAKKETKKEVKKETKTEEGKEKETVVGKISSGEGLAQRLLVKPHVSEKAARLADQGVYVFDVSLDAEKVAVRKAVEAMYKVKVEKVRMIRGIGKPIKRGRRMSSRKDWKKALVQVKKGQTLDLYEGV